MTSRQSRDDDDVVDGAYLVLHYETQKKMPVHRNPM